MTNRKLDRTSIYPYHVSARANNQEFFPINLNILWRECLFNLTLVYYMYQVRIHAFVLMSNHYHLIISTPKQNLDRAMMLFNGRIAKYINSQSNRINHAFGGRYKWSIINNNQYFSTVFRYVYQNPIKANLVKNVQDYPFSTIRQIVGIDKLTIPLDPLTIGEEFIFDDSPSRFLEMLNYRLNSKENECIKSGLRYRKMRIPKRKTKNLFRTWSQ